MGEGRATAAAAARLAAGMPWDETGEPGPSAGNGSAMRAGPAGLLFRSEPAELVRVASEQGMITHGDPRCSAGAVSVAGAVALAMQEGPIATEEFLHTLAEWSAPVDTSMAEALESLKAWIHLPPAESLRRIAGAGRDGKAEDDAGGKGITPFVVGSVLWSLYAFLRFPDDYWETICLAISGGGDTDTTAAMAGAMSGARVGLDALPPLLTMKLTDRGSWGYDELVGLAEECCELAGRKGD